MALAKAAPPTLARFFAAPPQAPYYAPESPSTDYATSFRGTRTPIVIDCGAATVRAGWATENKPRLIFETVSSKYRSRKTNTLVCFVGKDINFHDAWMKGGLRYPFDQNVFIHLETLEHILDHIFLKLGIDTSFVDHPIVFTEPLCVPAYTRKSIGEMLFDCYGVPAVAFGIDALFSLQKNIPGAKDAIIINAGHAATEIIPFHDGKILPELSRRINVGGMQMADFMLKLMQQKYPNFPIKMSLQQAASIVHSHCFVSSDFNEDLRRLADVQFIWEIDHVIQFPFTPYTDEKTAEEKEEIERRRKEQGKRLQEIAAQKRQEKLDAQKQKLDSFRHLKEMKKTESKVEFNEHLRANGLRSEAELDEEIKKLESSVRRVENKLLGIEETKDAGKEKEKMTFPLIDVPDSELGEAELKEKRKQKFIKASYDARERARKEKEMERARMESLRQEDEKRRLADPEKWLNDIRTQREKIMLKIADRQKARRQLANRRSQASQQRMRTIVSLASSGNPAAEASSEVSSSASGAPPSKRRRAGKKGEEEDTFGADDNDWLVYRDFSKDDSESEAEDYENLATVTQMLERHDVSFDPDQSANEQHLQSVLAVHTHGIVPRTANLQTLFGNSNNTNSKSTTSMTALLSNAESANIGWDASLMPYFSEVARQNQLHINIERLRVPEIIWQPSIIGIDQAGLIEVLQAILRLLGPDRSRAMLQNVFLAGTTTKIEGFHERIYHDIRSIAPVEMEVNVRQASDPRLDPWLGACQFANATFPSLKSVLEREDHRASLAVSADSDGNAAAEMAADIDVARSMGWLIRQDARRHGSARLAVHAASNVWHESHQQLTSF